MTDIVLEKDLTAEHAVDHRDRFKAALEGAEGDMRVDLRGISSVDSPGIALVVGLAKELSRRHARLGLLVSAGNIFRTFKALKLDRLVDVQVED
jgi:anti-anti-sigma factor